MTAYQVQTSRGSCPVVPIPSLLAGLHSGGRTTVSSDCHTNPRPYSEPTRGAAGECSRCISKRSRACGYMAERAPYPEQERKTVSAHCLIDIEDARGRVNSDGIGVRRRCYAVHSWAGRAQRGCHQDRQTARARPRPRLGVLIMKFSVVYVEVVKVVS